MIKNVVSIKIQSLPEQGLVELLSYAIALLAYRGRANVDDLRVLKALLDELPSETMILKAA